MKKAIVTLLILCLLGGGGYGAYYYYFKDKDQTSGRISSSSADAIYVDQVSVITGYGSGNGLIERYGGSVEPQATLGIKVEGDKKIKKCFVKEGDSVKVGDQLFVYDTTEEEDKKAQNEIDIEKDEGDIEISQKSIEQAEKAKKGAKEDELLDLSNTILTEQNNIKRAEYDIKTKQLEISQIEDTIKNATVKAELAGKIRSIKDPTDNPGGSESDYITIMADGDFRIKGKVNEANYLNGQLYEGMQILVYSRVDTSEKWYGRVTEVKTDNSSDQDQNQNYWMNQNSGSTNYDFYVELESSEGLILGQHVYMEENRGQEEIKDGLWLDAYYIVTDNDPYVWLANENNKIEKRAVTLGEYDDNSQKYEILDGLTPEDYIANPINGEITEGASVIYNDYTIPVEESSDDDTYDEAYDEDADDVINLDENEGFMDLGGEGFYTDAPENLAVSADDEAFDESFDELADDEIDELMEEYTEFYEEYTEVYFDDVEEYIEEDGGIIEEDMNSPDFSEKEGGTGSGKLSSGNRMGSVGADLQIAHLGRR